MNFLRKLIQKVIFFCPCLFLTFFHLSCAHAENSDLTMDLTTNSSEVVVTITNNEKTSLQARSLSIELAGSTLKQNILQPISPKKSRVFHFQTPAVPAGSFALVARLQYENAGRPVSAVSATRIHKDGPPQSAGECFLPSITLYDSLLYPVFHTSTTIPRFYLPSELHITSQSTSAGVTRFSIVNTLLEQDTRQSIFAILEDTVAGKHRATICSATIEIPSTVKLSRGLPNILFAVGATFGLLMSTLLLRKRSVKGNLLNPALIRNCFTLFLVSSFLFVFYNARYIPQYLIAYLPYASFRNFIGGEAFLNGIQYFLEWLYFAGPNYNYFAQFFVTPFFLYFLLCHYFVLRKADPDSLTTDKYWQLMIFCCERLHLIKRDESLPHHNYSPGMIQTAVLSLLIKAFFIPLFVSWSIQNFLHIFEAAAAFRFSIATMSQILISIIILVDVGIFTVGYLVEHPRFKNIITSTDATFLGWFSCLICYPPFNLVLFSIFDHSMNEQWNSTQGISYTLATVTITVLWIIYLWATISLGFKASNLTNRGIIESGPYAFVRHPAYAAKVLLWILSSFFLGTINSILVLALFAIYALRAWTEERHLSQDPHYQEYKQRVPSRIFPGVW